MEKKVKRCFICFWQNNRRNTKEYKTIFNDSSFSINLNIWTWIDYLSNVFLTNFVEKRASCDWKILWKEKEENNKLDMTLSNEELCIWTNQILLNFFVPLPKSYESVVVMALKFLSHSCNVKSSNSDPLEKGKNFNFLARRK